jgi:hypothetical protein
MPFTHAEDPAEQTPIRQCASICFAGSSMLKARNVRSTMPTSSAGSDAFHTATRFAGNTTSDEQSFLTSGGLSG